MGVIAPRKIQKSAIAVSASVGSDRQHDPFKIATRLHRSLKSLSPEMALQGFGLFLLREYQNVLFSLVNAIKRARRIAVWFCHQRKADGIIFTVSARRNGYAVGCPAPRSSILSSVANVFGKASPSVTVVTNGRYHRKARLAQKHQLHSHPIGRTLGVSVPPPHAILDGFKAIARPIKTRNKGVRNPIDHYIVSSLRFFDICHFYVTDLRLRESFLSVFYGIPAQI